MESRQKTKLYLETKNGIVVTDSSEGRGNRQILVRGYKILVIRWISFDDLMYNMVTIINKYFVYLKPAAVRP